MRYLFIFFFIFNTLLFKNSIIFGQDNPIFTLYLIGDAGLTAAGGDQRKGKRHLREGKRDYREGGRAH